MTHTNICGGQHNKPINNIRFAHWEKSSLALRAKALGFSRYCMRYIPKGCFMYRVIFCVFLMITSSTAWSCSCSSPELKERVANSRNIVVGRVVQLQENESNDAHQSLKGKIVVKESLKGNLTEDFYLFTGYGQGDCGLGFRVRDEYVFFLNDGRTVIGCQGHILNKNTGSRPSCFSSGLDYGFPTYEEQLKEIRNLLNNGI